MGHSSSARKFTSRPGVRTARRAWPRLVNLVADRRSLSSALPYCAGRRTPDAAPDSAQSPHPPGLPRLLQRAEAYHRGYPLETFSCLLAVSSVKSFARRSGRGGPCAPQNPPSFGFSDMPGALRPAPHQCAFAGRDRRGACLRRVETRRHGKSRSLGSGRRPRCCPHSRVRRSRSSLVARDERRTKLRAKPPGQEPPHSNGMQRGTRTLPRVSRPAKAVFCSCSCSCELADEAGREASFLPPVPRHCKPVKVSVRFAFSCPLRSSLSRLSGPARPRDERGRRLALVSCR